MKKIFCVLSAVILVFCSMIFSGCDGNENKKKETAQTESTEQTTQTKTTEEATQSKASADSDIQKYLDSFLEGDNDFYGAWQPEGFKYMSILFRNDKLAEMVTGTEGYFSKYSVNTKKKTVSLRLMPKVIDGEYSYKFSDNKQKLTLTLNGSTLKLIKQKNFSMLPKAPKKPTVDEDILGWWENEDGLFYCFQSDGIMYENSISMETCYTYTASGNKIKATYNSGGKMTDDFTYSFKNGTLTLNGSKCKKKTV